MAPTLLQPALPWPPPGIRSANPTSSTLLRFGLSTSFVVATLHGEEPRGSAPLRERLRLLVGPAVARVSLRSRPRSPFDCEEATALHENPAGLGETHVDVVPGMNRRDRPQQLTLVNGGVLSSYRSNG